MVGMHVVVSYCDQPLDWIWDQLLLLTEHSNLASPYRIKSITIFSQCGQTLSKNNISRLSKLSSWSLSVFAKHGIHPLRVVDLPKTVLVDGSSSNKNNNNVQQQHHYRRNDPAAYAYWIANYLMNQRNDDIATDLYYSQDQVLFVQDSHQTIYHPGQVDDINHSENTTMRIKAKFCQLYERSLQHGYNKFCKIFLPCTGMFGWSFHCHR
jgi:hypothetical protein